MLPLGPSEDDELELRDYLVVLRRRWVTVVATVVVALASSGTRGKWSRST
jgi:uncharacterized protein involved in exopolysaccharide biosynthesis